MKTTVSSSASPFLNDCRESYRMALTRPSLCVLILMVLEPCDYSVDGEKACSCYTFEDRGQQMDWPKANLSCEFNKKSLVVMETIKEWEFIYENIKNRTAKPYSEWHIGLFKNQATGNWTWINDKPLTFDKWQVGKPRDGDRYVLIAKEFPPGLYGSFNSIKGNIQRGWICEEQTDECKGTCMPHYPASTATMAPPKTVTTPSRESTTLVSTTEKLSHISGTTFYYNCHEYTVYKLPPAQRPKWNESRNLCSESGSHLVCIEHQQEINFLEQKLIELRLESEYFIGLEKQNEKWTWICNRSTVVTPKKSPWAIHQPSGNGPCAEMYFVRKGLVYNDIYCDVRQDYICERRNSSCPKKAEPDIDEKETVKPTTIHTLPDISIATDSVITTRQQHEGDYTTIANSSSMSSVTAFIPKKGKPSHIPWMIAALLGWTVVIFLSFWLWLRKAPRKEDSASGDVEADVTSMNLTDIRSQMSEQEGGYAALNMHRMMCPNSATYTSLVSSGQESSSQGPGSCMESHLQEGARKDVLSETYEII